MFSAGIPSTSAATVGALSPAEPLAASCLGFLVLHEHLTPTAVLGSLLLMDGLAAARLPTSRARSATGPSPGHQPQAPDTSRKAAAPDVQKVRSAVSRPATRAPRVALRTVSWPICFCYMYPRSW
ncbi:hypothetical protein [Streptomyces albofaciens]|uniref:hypothetical protein n=1 Tax=Streptomyces albofaciens TaxID=66866 RepID=UPI003CC75292